MTLKQSKLLTFLQYEFPGKCLSICEFLSFPKMVLKSSLQVAFGFANAISFTACIRKLVRNI